MTCDARSEGGRRREDGGTHELVDLDLLTLGEVELLQDVLGLLAVTG